MLLNWGHYQHYVEEILNDVANLNKDKILERRSYHLEEQKQTLKGKKESAKIRPQWTKQNTNPTSH